MLPSVRLILMVVAAAPVFLAGAVFRPLTAVGLIYVLVLVLYMAIDALLLPARRKIEIHRSVPQRVSLLAPTRIVLTVRNLTRRRLRIQLAEDLPAELSSRDERLTGLFDAGAAGTLEYRLVATKRGAHALRRLYVRALPAMGLFYRQFVVDLPEPLHVFPNLVNLRQYELRVRRGLMAEMGLARVKRLGQGSEFESLRLYGQGDPLSRVEWKATAKRSRLIVRNYQPEREQSVIVALDVGRATAGQFDGVSRLDHFVNATMILAYVVLRQGDWLSLVAFSDRIESYLPRVRHIKSIERVAEALYRLEPRLVESDYAAACRFLGLKNRKRSLICLMTDVIDRHANADIIAYMGRFARRHLPLVITLNDPEIQAAANRPLSAGFDPYTKAMALDVLSAREQALQAMRHSGVGVLAAEPGALSPDLINRYALIKSTHRL